MQFSDHDALPVIDVLNIKLGNGDDGSNVMDRRHHLDGRCRVKIRKAWPRTIVGKVF
jgi:hypothetical protein